MDEHIHFIGIGGSGLSAIARLLHDRGVAVSGSDQQSTPFAERLRAEGVPVYAGHAPQHINGATLVIRSSAVPDDNVEVVAARKRGIPVLKRADYLGRLMSEYTGIAVAGTHGKTTTTSMLVWMLTTMRKDPTFIVGGTVANLGTNARAGRGPYFVVEADEYDHMFLGLRPQMAIITNVEHDHPDCFPTPADFEQAFAHFVERLQPEGTLLACTDDPGAAGTADHARGLGRRVYSYGLQASADYRALEVSAVPGAGSVFAAAYRGAELGVFRIQVPGVHNVRNALAVLAAGHQLGLPAEEMAHAVESFKGSGRRFELRGQAGGVTVIDDYAHHPTEIRTTIAAARSRYPNRDLWVIWQPHTYSRVRLLFEDFASAFQGADHVIVTAVYAAREQQPPDFSLDDLAAAISAPDVRLIPDLPEVARQLIASLQPENVLLTLSAGDADQVSAWVLSGLAEAESHPSD